MIDLTAKSAIVPYPLSDHAAITLKVGPTPTQVGPGLWRIDNALSCNEDYQKIIRDLLAAEEDNPEGSNPRSH